ncbi:MAG TPA: MmcQ/YjbR family DNA-binding protein [Terriglobales bacterium]|nr:MmcQ/YjbR family DNA-binding protein [Terriglobales bacterium]
MPHPFAVCVPAMPLTTKEFRQLALALPEAAESAHMGHPDFRVHGKIFATLNYPEKGWGMVKLSPEQQDMFMREYPASFSPSAGAWGRRGATSLRLKAVAKSAARKALAAAWRNTAPKQLVQQFDKEFDKQ